MNVVGGLLLRRTLTSLNSFSKHTAAMSQNAIIAVCQMRATDNKAENMATCETLIASAKRFNAKMVFLPEACDYVATNTIQTIEMAEDLNGTTIECFKQLAKNHDMWLSLGGLHIKVDDKTVRNAHILISPQGEIKADYSKLHLFDVDYEGGNIHLKESSYCQPGKEIVPPIPTPVGNIGLSICYDLRFPELSMHLRMLGADILTYPSAFTFATGASHWESLLRARAIETQCYVVAAAQSGVHNKKRTSWGHAMVVDPWGTIIAQCSDGPNIAVAEIDLSFLSKTRLSMPVLEHRRNDVYPSLIPQHQAVLEDRRNDVHPSPMPDHQVKLQKIVDEEEFQFGQVFVKGTGIFAKTACSMAFTNKKCVVPGHVLVAPLRCVQRLSELSPLEIADLFTLVHEVTPVVESTFQGTSSTVVVQDGKEAGQTIRHVHVHILPRRAGDYLNNDDIYRDLANHDKEGCTTGEWRTENEMASEALKLRCFFPL